VADYRIDDPEAPVRPAIFVPFLQNPRARAMLFLRTATPPAALAGAVRREVAAADRMHAVHDVKTMGERLRDATARGRFSARVLGAFAAAALLLAAVGIYGVLALAVTQRTREFGVRLALGADRGRVVGMVLREAMALTALGAAVGLVGALAAARALRSLLYDLAPADPWTYAATVAVLALAAAAAALVPAVRAARASPLEAIRATE
jgi:ABC-type antimicrobial peptide transport system permease subunit